jgi:diphthine synthase
MGTLYFIGLGLFDVSDISVKGLDIVRNADAVLAEFYTSVIPGSTHEDMERLFGREVRVLSREEVEGEEVILETLENGDSVLLTGGDPMSATTHQSLRLEAGKRGYPVRIVHASSIFTAVPGLLGLPAYKFGRTTTLARPEKEYFPTSPYDVIRENLADGLHTLVLLDIKSDEGYFMTADAGIDLILRMEREVGSGTVGPDTMVAVGEGDAGNVHVLVVHSPTPLGHIFF